MTPPHPDTALRLGIVFENTVGHVTFAQTLATVLAGLEDVAAHFFPVSFTSRGLVDRLGLAERNWSLRSSLHARAALTSTSHELDALLFHTQTCSLLSVALMRRIPSVVSLDATPANYDEVGAGYGHYRESDAREALKRAVVRRSLTAAGRLVAWSDWVRRSLVADYAVDGSQIETVPAGTDLRRHPSRRGLRRPGPPRLLFVGGSFERKGGPLLLRALSRMHPTPETTIVTGEHVAAEGVRVITGLHPGDPAIDRLYADADVFVLPTLADASPHVILEAMAAGLPVIATAIGAIPEVVRDEETGLLIQPHDVDALLAGLERLCSDLGRTRAMGERGRARVEDHFDAERNVVRIVEVVRETASRTPGRH